MNVPVESLAREQATEHFGGYVDFVGMDNPTSNRLTRERVGWNPTRPTIIEDIERGAYSRAIAS